MFTVLTIAREYGSGGSDIGHRVAEILGWECIDKQIIDKIAALGSADPKWAAMHDEHATTWWERVMKSLRAGTPETYIAAIDDAAVDKDTVQKFTANLIQEVAKVGNCVIIGRSSGAVLRDQSHVLRLFVYAPLIEKLHRMKARHPHEANLPALLQRIDNERIRYAQSYYGLDPANRSHYHLALNSTLGVELCAQLVVDLIKSQRGESA